MKISFISNFTIEPFLYPCVRQYFVNHSHQVKFINIDDYLAAPGAFSDTNLFIVWLNIEFLLPKMLSNLSDCNFNYELELISIKGYLQQIYDLTINSAIQTIFIGFEDYYYKEYFLLSQGEYYSIFIHKLNCWLEEHFIYMDLQQLIAKIGLSNTYDIRYLYNWDNLYSVTVYHFIAEKIIQFCENKRKNIIKCIIVDCDNVLWSGIAHEDGVENIGLGIGPNRVYSNFQKLILSYYNHGIILAISSKNTETVIMNVFDHHKGMILKKQYFSIMCINWKNKASNIDEISRTLHINYENILFIDDSYLEIEEVKYLLPKIQTLLFDKYNVFKDMKQFIYATTTNFSGNLIRQHTYQNNVKRNHMQSQFLDYQQFLSALQMEIKIVSSSKDELYRIAELSQRTSRMTNGKRYTLPELQKCFVQENYILRSVYFKDRFGDLGLIGAYGIICKDSNITLDLFCLSCRAINRTVEGKMIDDIVNNFGAINRIYFRPTGHNQVSNDLFSMHCEIFF